MADVLPPAAGRQPILNLPPMVTALLLVNIAVHLLRLLLPEPVDQMVILTFGFIPARYVVPELFGWQAVVSPVTYQFLHGGWLHLGANMLALMAFGSGVERRVGPWRMLVFALVCGVFGAAAQAAIDPQSLVPVIGASGAINGLFGAVLRFLPRHGAAPRMRQLWPVVLLWIGLNVLFGQPGMLGNEGASIAWVAHIGAFVAGFLLFGLFDRRAESQ